MVGCHRCHRALTCSTVRHNQIALRGTRVCTSMYIIDPNRTTSASLCPIHVDRTSHTQYAGGHLLGTSIAAPEQSKAHAGVARCHAHTADIFYDLSRSANGMFPTSPGPIVPGYFIHVHAGMFSMGNGYRPPQVARYADCK